MARTKKSAPTTAPESAPAQVSPPETPQGEPVTLTGRLVADPVVRTTQNGVSVANFRIAVSYDDGRPATFHNVVAWKATADAVGKYMRKGRLVEVRGQERARTWTDKDGAERTSVEISAFSVQFLSRPQQAVAGAGVGA